MAPMAIYEQHHALKRTSSQALFDDPVPKKIKNGLKRHITSFDLQREHRHDAALQDQEAAEALLTRSINLALEAVGFEAAQPTALEGFRLLTEEYMAHFLCDVRQSMLASRRIHPIPQDFLQALHSNQLSLRALMPHLNPPVPTQKSQLPLSRDLTEREGQQEYRSISSFTVPAQSAQPKKYIPKHFPLLPDDHTYQAHPVYPVREQDPRKIREQATEDGRLGEEALRKLVSASVSQRPSGASTVGKPLGGRAQRDQMWRETMIAVAQQDQAGGDSQNMDLDVGKIDENGKDSLAVLGHLSSAVNSEKRFWRKNARP